MNAYEIVVADYSQLGHASGHGGRTGDGRRSIEPIATRSPTTASRWLPTVPQGLGADGRPDHPKPILMED